MIFFRFFKHRLCSWIMVLALFNVNLSCAQSNRLKANKATNEQGICGTVVIKRGNFMPGPGRPTPKGQPAEREILIYPLLNINQIDAGENGFINSVREAKPINIVQSDQNGTFCVSLPVGRYSILVREPKGLYANGSDTQNNIFPVTVQKNHQTTVTIEITHEATF